MADGQGVALQPTVLETGAGGISPAEAQAAIAALIEAEETPQPARNDKGQFTKAAPEAQAKPETEAPAEEEAKAEATPEPEVKEEEAQPEPRKLKLKYKGEEKEVDEAEAIELAQKGYDYSQKTAALAKEREEVAAEKSKAQEDARKAYMQQLETYRQSVLRVVDPEVLNADLGKMAAEDPARAQQLFFKRQQIAETLQAIQSEQHRLASEEHAKAQQNLQKQVRESWEALETKIPGWNNDSYRKILDFGKTYGFKAEEVNAITDHRAIEVLNDARQWREYLAAKPKTVDKRVTSVPKVQKPGTGEVPNAKTDKVKEGMAQLSKSGSRADAQAVVLQMIEEGRL